VRWHIVRWQVRNNDLGGFRRRGGVFREMLRIRLLIHPFRKKIYPVTSYFFFTKSLFINNLQVGIYLKQNDVILGIFQAHGSHSAQSDVHEAGKSPVDSQ